MEEVVIIHLSDLHFSESDFWERPPEKSNWPHRSGHDPYMRPALDKILKSFRWDKIVISGDLSRIGHTDSFGYVKNWLYGEIIAPNGQRIGLKLAEDRNDCILVPGNHDCFNGGKIQHSLTNYDKCFPHISGSKVIRTEANGISINFHLYDSTYPKGGFAKGHIYPVNFSRFKTNDETLDIVVVHHHLAQHPEHKRHRTLEMVNTDDFLAFLLSENINAVLFGHTHERFFENVSAEMLKKYILIKRKYGRWFGSILLKYWFSQKMPSLSFNRIPTKSGRFPSFDKYFEYLYLRDVLKEKDILGPDKFKGPQHFYDHVKSFRSDYGKEIKKVRQKKVAFSMSPSPCYSGGEKNGFHRLIFRRKNSKFWCECQYYKWDGNDFVFTDKKT